MLASTAFAARSLPFFGRYLTWAYSWETLHSRTISTRSNAWYTWLHGQSQERFHITLWTRGLIKCLMLAGPGWPRKPARVSAKTRGPMSNRPPPRKDCPRTKYELELVFAVWPSPKSKVHSLIADTTLSRLARAATSTAIVVGFLQTWTWPQGGLCQVLCHVTVLLFMRNAVPRRSDTQCRWLTI
jgi:hypothetical protein